MRTFSSVVVLFVAFSTAALAQHAPGDGAPFVDSGIDLQGHSRLFVSSDNVEGMFEYVARYDADQRLYDFVDTTIYHAITVGGYYRAFKNLKLGAFYKLQFGARHDEDWIDGPVDWMWRDTSGRAEHVIMADATPRLQLKFLPGENWILSVKNRYEISLYQQDGDLINLQSLLIRPGLTYFLIKDREPLANISFQYGVYVPLNFGENLWYQHGPYLNLMYHFMPGLSADVSFAYQTSYWSESTEFDEDWPNNSYLTPVYKHWSVDLGVIYKLAR